MIWQKDHATKRSRGGRSYRRTLRIESLEQRIFLAGDTYLVNFQDANSSAPNRYLVDIGLVFGVRGGGLSYGWSSDHTDQARVRNIAPDQRLDTLIHFEVGQSWEFALSNGMYEVTVSIGDPQFDSTHTLNVENVNYWSAVPLSPNSFLTVTQQVTVNDGRLTLNQGAAIDKATRINYIHIVGLPAGPNGAPATPTITEPSVDGQVVHPGDVHMETVGYSDADGNLHKSTDWEIWTVGPGAQPVWQTLGIAGVERLHTHMGDGIFINSRAGQSDLAPDTNYELRVRFRDDAGSVSGYATRTFHTGLASTVFPMELQDVLSSPSPSWTKSSGGNVSLPPSSPTQSQFRLESESGGQLLTITGASTSNPPALANHAMLRVVVVAGSNVLSLEPSNFAFRDDDNLQRTIFLPAFNLAAGQRLDLWVAIDGSTYYGTAAQTEPDFSNLARSADLPFVALQPGYKIEVVATGMRLPVNIAFVPNPGPHPQDPLYYVTELYGSIQVVRRDGTHQTFATGLLDYNPQGPFGGTGEQGLTGIAVERDSVDPDIYHLYVGMLWDNGSPPGPDFHYPKVERIDSAAGGLTMASRTILLNMQPETQGQSHQISNITIGPDGKLYVHTGDGFDYTTARNRNMFRGKVLRMNLDGTAPSDNPFYNAANGISAEDYVFAYGLRNPFGGAWRASDGKHYEVENGPNVDRLAQINRGVDYGWNDTDASMFINAKYNWTTAHAPVNIAFVQQATFAGSQFPAGMMDHAFVSESGPTWAMGAQTNGKRIVEFVLDANGDRLSGPTSLIQYSGLGHGSVVGLAAGPDGLYFTELYEDSGAGGATGAGARIFRVRYENPVAGDYNIDGTVDQDDYTVWKSNFGSNLFLAADGNHNGVVDAADYTVWRDNLIAPAAAAVGSASIASPSDKAVGNEGTQALTWTTPTGTTKPVARHHRSRGDRALSERHGDRQMAILAALEALHPHRTGRFAESLKFDAALPNHDAEASCLPQVAFDTVADALFAMLDASP